MGRGPHRRLRVPEGLGVTVQERDRGSCVLGSGEPVRVRLGKQNSQGLKVDKDPPRVLARVAGGLVTTGDGECRSESVWGWVKVLSCKRPKGRAPGGPDLGRQAKA